MWQKKWEVNGDLAQEAGEQVSRRLPGQVRARRPGRGKGAGGYISRGKEAEGSLVSSYTR